MPIIKLKNISYKYSDKPILTHLNLGIEAGTITYILGSSGSGKTTILRLIAGLETPDEGEINIEGKPVSQKETILIPSQKRQIGYIFQDLALWPHMTIYKNIAFGPENIKEENIEDKVIEVLSFFGLEEYAQKFPHQLSGGQQQMVAIARALVLKPKILLMDEPLASLDVKSKRKILEYIVTIKNRYNLTIVYVTHDHREAFAIADRIVVINEGKIQESGSVEQIKQSNNEYIQYFLEW